MPIREFCRTSFWWRGRAVWRFAVFWAGLLGAAVSGQANDGTYQIRFAFSTRVFTNMNLNDAQAAITVWADAIVEGWDFNISTTIQLIDGLPAVKQALAEQRVEVISMTLEEFWQLRRDIPVGPIVLSATGNEFFEEYVVLVRADGEVDTLADLRGASMRVWSFPRMGPSEAWLEIELMEGGLGRLDQVLRSRKAEPKLSQTVLPVFFGQATACLTTKRGFELMCELNPQLKKSLKVIAISPRVIPTVCFFRADFDHPRLSDVVQAISEVGHTSAGKQTLTLFQQDQLIPAKLSDLDESCALLERHQRLLATDADSSR